MSNTKLSVSVDSLDLKILNLLIDDAKLSYAEIGKRLGVSSGTIFVRVKKMNDLEIIKGTYASLDYDLLGYPTQAHVGIHTIPSASVNDIAKELSALNNVLEVHITSGKYPLLCLVRCSDLNTLNMILNDQIRSIKGIQDIETTITLNMFASKQMHIDED